MGSNNYSDPDDGDAGLKDFLAQLLTAKELDGAAEGIAKQAVARGLDSLSDLQKDTLENHALAKWREHRICSVEHCGETMPWDEVDAYEGDEQVCSRCKQKIAQD